LNDHGGVAGRSHAHKINSKWWTPERQAEAVDYLIDKAGLSKWGASGLVARWAGVESAGGPTSVNPNSGAFGIAQWLGARKRGIAGNTDFHAQLEHVAAELRTTEATAGEVLKNAQNAFEGSRGASMFERAEGYNPRTGIDNFTRSTPAAQVYAERFGAPKSGVPSFVGSAFAGEYAPHSEIKPATPIGSSSVSSYDFGSNIINNKNNFTINEAKNAGATGREVAAHQGRVNADLLRNLQSAAH
jgi:Phage tail lysozyme